MRAAKKKAEEEEAARALDGAAAETARSAELEDQLAATLERLEMTEMALKAAAAAPASPPSEAEAAAPGDGSEWAAEKEALEAKLSEAEAKLTTMQQELNAAAAAAVEAEAVHLTPHMVNPKP